MPTLKRMFLALLALIILVGGVGWSAQPAQAASCAYYHTVRYGESLSWIGRYYGVYWPYLAQINGIKNPRWIYAGQVLCIPTGYYGGYYQGGVWWGGTGGQPVYGTNMRTWSFSVIGVVPNTTVTFQTYNAPNNVAFSVHMGVPSGNQYNWQYLGDIDTGNGGTQAYTINIPAAFANSYQLKLRLTQTKKNGKVFQQDQVFYNTAYNPGTGGTGGIPVNWGWGYYPGYNYGVPTIWIVSVSRDNTVTIQTNNFPAGVNFDVLMGPMGTRGVGGYYVGTLNSGAGGTLSATFPIPPQLYGQYQIAIRTQNLYTGYYSYNWFYNNTTY